MGKWTRRAFIGTGTLVGDGFVLGVAGIALAMMAAEEMEAEWDLVRVNEAPALDIYANAYIARVFTGDAIPPSFERAVDYGGYRLARWFGLQATGGSTSVRGTGVYRMSVAGAAAKEMLISAAAERFGVPATECAARTSRVIHGASGQRPASVNSPPRQRRFPYRLVQP